VDWKDFLKPEYIWAFVGVFLLIMEVFMPGLIVFFFGVGAMVVAIACAIWHITINTQLILFIVTSVVLLAALRRWLKGVFMGFTSDSQDSEKNTQDFVGKKVVVIQTISPIQPGIVELNGTNWNAAAEMTIAAGAVVEIIGNDNLTLHVKPVKQAEGETK
jgi:membrane protein implicated in regulation of membrane protease activity